MEEVPRPQKIEMPLSDTVRVYVIFDGTPDLDDFTRFHRVVDLIRDAFYPEAAKIDAQSIAGAGALALAPAPAPAPAIAIAPAPRKQKTWAKKKLRKLPPCEKHPEGERSKKTNRCLQCESERAEAHRERMFVKWQTKAAGNGQ